MPKTKKRGPKPRPKAAGKPASRLLAVLLVLALVIPMASSLIALGISGVRDLSDAVSGLDGDAAWLRDLLEDSGCPPRAAKSIALRARDEGWLPVFSVYYVPEDATGPDGSAVMVTERHMVSAAVRDGRMYAIQVTDPYQNASLLQQASLDADAAQSAAEFLHGNDAGLLSDADGNGDGTLTLALPDGTFVLSGEDGNWKLDPRKGDDGTGGE